MIRKYKMPTPIPSEMTVCDFSLLDLATLIDQLQGMEISQLTTFATDCGIDIGKATTQKGIYDKIVEHLEAVKQE